MTDLANAIDLLVHLRAVVEALLTGTRDGEGDARWMPRSDACNLAQTLVRLALQFSGSPARGHS